MSIQSKRTVKISDDDVNWFKREYPDASLSWILSQLLRAFREAHQKTPKDYIKESVQSTLDMEL